MEKKERIEAMYEVALLKRDLARKEQSKQIQERGYTTIYLAEQVARFEAISEALSGVLHGFDDWAVVWGVK